MEGQPCIRGQRFTVAQLVRLIAEGWDLAQIQEDFPFIEAEDVHQALLYAANATESMSFPLREPVADKNLSHRLEPILEEHGHDVVHVDVV